MEEGEEEAEVEAEGEGGEMMEQQSAAPVNVIQMRSLLYRFLGQLDHERTGSICSVEHHHLITACNTFI